MAYDPQANRRRPHPDPADSAPVDALLGATKSPWVSREPDDPPPRPAVTPVPADPPSDTLLLRTAIAASIGTLLAAVTLRHLWIRRQRNRSATTET